MSSSSLSSILLPALRFAARDDFQNLARLKGVEALVGGAVARVAVDDAVRAAVVGAAAGFDDAPDVDKRARVARLIALLESEGESPLPHPAASTSTEKPRPRPATATSKEKPLPQSPARGGERDAGAASTTTKRPPLATRKPSPGDVDPLTWPVSRLKGTGPQKAQALIDRGLVTVGDVLLTLPRTYEDRRTQSTIATLQDGLLAVVSGTVKASGVVGGGRGRRYEAVVDDGSGQLRLVFFHFRLPEMQKRLARGEVVTVAGDVKRHGGRLAMVHPRLQGGAPAPGAPGLGGVEPVYPEVQGLHPLELARVAKAAIDVIDAFDDGRGPPDPLPAAVRARAEVPGLKDALRLVHRPADDIDADALAALVHKASPGHRRLAFEELLVLGIALSLRRRAQGQDPAPALKGSDGEREAIAKLVPFALTGAQRRAAAEIVRDVEKPVPMARLLQGDVGAGKTAVAAIACLRAARAGFQAAFMAPTEILAEQHGRNLKKVGFAAGLRVEVLTGSLGKKARALLESRIRNRDVDVVVGTQALLSDGVDFCRLGLCVVDEQHRFGVVQRALLRKKGPVIEGVGLTPHLLVMTATPIPRSLTLTVYGDLAVSVLDELPPGRTPVATRVITDWQEGLDAIAATLAKDERVFVVYPLIDETEKVQDVAAATQGFEDLKANFGDDVVLLHGKMSSSDKDAAMEQFARGQKRVLVSTTVVEVGVDVPTATLMIIVNAERFGLAQLHQLRGRVGRSARASTCLLLSGSQSGDAAERLHTLEETNDGFVIAQKDLELRGPGDVLGTRQSGLPSLAFSDLVTHAPLIELAREIADDVVDRDPALARPEHAGLKKLVWDRYAERLALTAAG